MTHLAEIIPARIETQIAVCWAGWDRRYSFRLLERAVALAGPRINQREVGNEGRTIERVFGNRLEFNCNLVNVAPLQLDKKALEVQGYLSLQSSWKRGSLQNWSNSSLRTSSLARRTRTGL
jgi:hypothetical protein